MVKDDGFDLKDFDSVLVDCPFVFTIDWRAFLQEELETIQESLAKLDVDLKLELNEEGESGYVLCQDRREPVAYRPVDNSDFDDVIHSIQSVVNDNLEFRESPWNRGSDTMVYAVLPVDEWADLEKEAPEVMDYLFRPFSPVAK